MNDARKLESIVGISSTPSTSEEQNRIIDTLKEKLVAVQDPSELDEATKNMGMPAALLNFYLATQEDLSAIGLGKAVYIPVMISQREGGRKSIYFLDQNEEVLAGIYVTNQGIALKFMKRVTGSSLPAQAGDVYFERITNRDGELIYEGSTKLVVFDPQTGAGKFHQGHREEAVALEVKSEETEENTSTLHIYITEDPLTAHSLNTIISAITELSTKLWLIVKGRFADLIEYTQAHNPQFPEEAHLIIEKLTHNSPLEIKLNPGMKEIAEALKEGIDAVSQTHLRYDTAKLDNEAKRLANEAAALKTKLEEQESRAALKSKKQTRQIEIQRALLEIEKQQLELERQRVALQTEILELEHQRVNLAFETASKIVERIASNENNTNKAMLIQSLIPQLLQLGSGKGLTLALPAPQSSGEKRENG
jgi:hypothetical protein